ncbi:hypothetical protein ORI89_12880, partial [Sphingobacterium sp. UT-1RO-CII-1]|uniref:hypothetical protein n=1 Tax=Sphingobacterium sp. UT-1RO-CII-1 TaxID=2995225 RepID=UPI00227C728C
TTGTLTGNGIVITGDGVDALLKDIVLSIEDGAITTAKLADGAVTANKMGAAEDGSEEGMVPVANADGTITYKKVGVDGIDAKDLTAADYDEDPALDKSTIEVVTGGEKAVLVETSLRVKEESITTGHIQNGTIKPEDIAEAGANQVLVTGDNKKPVWKDAKKVAPQFFYMPAVIFDTSKQGTATRDLYQEYVNQFTGGKVGAGNETYPISHGPAGTTPVQYAGGIVGSAGAPDDIVVFENDELYYYVTYYDETVFENLSITEEGKLTYTVKAGATPSSYMNIVFVIK